MDLILTSLIDYAFQAALVVVLALGGVAINWFTKKTGLDIDAQQRRVLEDIISAGIGLARTKIVGADGQVSIPIKNEVMALAANYVIANVPDALKHFQIDPSTLEGKTKIQKMVEARLANFGI